LISVLVFVSRDYELGRVSDFGGVDRQSRTGLIFIGNLNVLQSNSLNVADVAENMWCLMSKIVFWLKFCINSKVTILKNSKFPDKGWNANGLNYLLKKLPDTSTIAIGNQDVDEIRVNQGNRVCIQMKMILL